MVATDTLDIWIVEDDSSYRQAMTMLVAGTPGMACREAWGDAEALLAAVRAGAAPPNVVLMDIHLPGMSGIEGVAALKALLPDARIVMITNDDDDRLIFDAFRAGASGYLLKNAPVDTIVAALWEAHGGGMLMPPGVAQHVLRHFAQQAPAQDYGLTPRELDVLELMVEGLIQKEIAERLFISPSTVNGHIQHIYEKLHVHSSSAAVAKALRERLL